MPRSNRPRRRGPADDEPELDLNRILTGGRRVEHRRGGSWNVQPVSPARRSKTTSARGALHVVAGTGHIVAWRADGLMGEATIWRAAGIGTATAGRSD